MQRYSRLLISATGVVVLFGAVTILHPLNANAETYVFQQVEIPQGFGEDIQGINNAEHIVGRFQDNAGQHGFILRGLGGTFEVIDVSGASNTNAFGINDLDDVVGTASLISGGGGSFFNSATFNPPNSDGSGAGGVNNLGNIVGGYNDCCLRPDKGYFLDGVGGSFTTIFYPESSGTTIRGVNDSGEMVGVFDDENGGGHGFYLKEPNGVPTEVIFPDVIGAILTDINNNGEMVGIFADAAGTHGFHLSGLGEVFTPINFPGATKTDLQGLNDLGQLVGNYIDPQGITHGFLATPVGVLTADSFIKRHRRNQNEGANHNLVVQKKGRKRTVVGFDLSKVPADVTQATLILSIAQPPKKCGKNGRMVDVHRLLESFTEGNGFVWGQPKGLRDRGSGAGVTWKCATDTDIANRKRDCDNKWGGGLDAAETVTDSTVITKGQTGEVSWNVTVDVQAALANGDTEIQWLIKKAREKKKGKVVFYSKEGAADLGDMTKAPRLELEFQ